MRISVINYTHGLISDSEMQNAIRAINRQIEEDFSPYWNVTGKLRLEGNSQSNPNADNPEDMQGEAVIYIWDESDVPNALGYHEANYRGIPYGFVFVDISTELDESWTVTFSHEALELLGDRQANLLVHGPHPAHDRYQVYHWREMCDAVQYETYSIDEVEVSNFVLPLYFTADAEPGSRNDFLGTRHWSKQKEAFVSLESFGVNPGGYVGFYDPISNEHSTESGPEPSDIDNPDTSMADHRRKRRNKARMARRGNRYTSIDNKLDLKKMEKGKPKIIAENILTNLNVNGKRIKVRCKTDTLTIETRVKPLSRNKEIVRGYFAHDIYSDARTLDKELKDLGYSEIGAIEIEPVTRKLSESEIELQGRGKNGSSKAKRRKKALVESELKPDPEVEFLIQHGKNEAILAVVEVEGVLFWHEPKYRAGVAKFTIGIQYEDETLLSRRAFLGKASKMVVRFIKQKLVDKVGKKIKNKLTEYLAETIEKHAFNKGGLEKGELLQFKLRDEPLNGTVGEITQLDEELGDEKYLLLIHGIFSSPKGGFKELLLNYGDKLLFDLSKRYKKIIAYNHWTVAKTTLENAEDLLAALPDKCQLDIVCHSRGAGVARCLLEHPRLAAKLQTQGRSIRVGKVIFVAGACQGSPLANPKNIGKLLNTFSALSSVSGAYFPVRLVTGLLKAVQYGVSEFPGIKAMSPNSPIVKQLNKPIFHEGSKYIYMRSDFEPEGKLARMLDQLALDKFVFNNEPNDAVVPFDGAGKFDDAVDEHIKPVPGPEFGVTQRDNVLHTKFFKEKRVRETLLKHLA